MTQKGTVEASTRGGADASLLAQALADSLLTATRVRLSAIPSVDEALCELGTFAFVDSHLFSAGRRHSSVVVDLLCLITRLEELHTEVQGMILSPDLVTTLLYNFLWRWKLYLNRFVAVLVSEYLDAPGCQVPFYLEPSLADLEEGHYVRPILPTALGDLVSRARDSIEEHQRCFRLGGYFMATMWAVARYSRGGFSLCRAGSAWCVMVPGEITFHLETGTIHPCWNLLVPDVLDSRGES